MLQGTHPSEAEGRGKSEQSWRRSPVPALKTTMWRRWPEPKEKDCVIKTESLPPTDATRERDWGEEVSPTLETKIGLGGRKRGNSELASFCKDNPKQSEG